MDINLNNNCYCLTISDLKYENLCHNFTDCGLKKPFKFEGFIRDDIVPKDKKTTELRHFLCSMGHFSMLFTADILNLEYCCILEEDSYCIDKNINTTLNNILNDLYKTKWEILILGYDAIYPEISPFTSNPPEYNDYFKIIKKYILDDTKYCYRLNTQFLSGSHALIIKNTAYKKIMNRIVKDRQPVDKFYARTKDCITYISKKSLFYQKDNNLFKKPFYTQTNYDIGPISFISDNT